MPTSEIYIGDCREYLAAFDENTFDAILTDPPYELGFMGKKWDASGIAYDPAVWTEALRVLKPGGHMLAFGGTRTYHRMTCAIEDSGFEIRDCLQWLYGTGFPKSLNLDGGLGTALKPANEPIVMARKPLVGTVAKNVDAYGAGTINIDDCRIGTEGGTKGCDAGPSNGILGDGLNGSFGKPVPGLGRWPANVLLDEDAAAQLGEVSRFFYTAKASRSERDAGVVGEHQTGGELTNRKDGSAGLANPRAGAGRTSGGKNVHPTVKPITLMRYLVKLITPLGGMVLDPFMGSGSTGVAAVLEDRDFTGIELSEEYAEIARQRIEHWLREAA